MSVNKICPQHKAGALANSNVVNLPPIIYCDKEECAWWNEEFKVCSMNLVARCLDQISADLHRMRNK